MIKLPCNSLLLVILKTFLVGSLNTSYPSLHLDTVLCNVSDSRKASTVLSNNMTKDYQPPGHAECRWVSLILRVCSPAPESHQAVGFQLWPLMFVSYKSRSSLSELPGSLLTPNRATEQPPHWPVGMVVEERRLPEGRNQVRRISQTPSVEQRPPRKSRKKLQVIICVLLVELCERFTFFGIVCNMILFCTVKLGYDNYLAATVNLCFIGASTLTPVLVGWFAETCLGRTKVLYLCALLHFFGKKQHDSVSRTV